MAIKTNFPSASWARPEWSASASFSCSKTTPGLRSRGSPPATAPAAKRLRRSRQVAPRHAAAPSASPNDRLAGRAPTARPRSSSPPSTPPSPASWSPLRQRRLRRDLQLQRLPHGPNVPLVIPEINAEHLHLIEEQPSRARIRRLHGHQSQLLHHRPGDGSQTHRGASASSRSSSPPCRPSAARAIPACLHGHPRQRGALHRQRRRKMEAETLKLLGKLKATS
jgi:hypothetical protein